MTYLLLYHFLSTKSGYIKLHKHIGLGEGRHKGVVGVLKFRKSLDDVQFKMS